MIETMISRREAASSVMLIRRATMRPPRVSREVACPRPQNDPMRDDRRQLGSVDTMVETATTWSGSSACLRPRTKPSTTALQSRDVMRPLRYGIRLAAHLRPKSLPSHPPGGARGPFRPVPWPASRFRGTGIARLWARRRAPARRACRNRRRSACRIGNTSLVCTWRKGTTPRFRPSTDRGEPRGAGRGRSTGTARSHCSQSRPSSVQGTPSAWASGQQAASWIGTGFLSGGCVISIPPTPSTYARGQAPHEPNGLRNRPVPIPPRSLELSLHRLCGGLSPMSTVRERPKPFLLPQFCKGCGRCIEACPKHCITVGTEINPATGLVPVHLDLEPCNGCGLCISACPEPYGLRAEPGKDFDLEDPEAPVRSRGTRPRSRRRPIPDELLPLPRGRAAGDQGQLRLGHRRAARRLPALLRLSDHALHRRGRADGEAPAETATACSCRRCPRRPR